MYKIEDAKKRKRTNFQLLRQWIHLLLNNEINKLSRIKSKGGPGGGRKPGSKNKMTLDKLAKIVMGISNDVKNIKTDITNLNSRFDNLVEVNNLKE